MATKPKPEELRVHDHSLEADRKFVKRTMTRSALRAHRDCIKLFAEFQESMPEDPADATSEQEDKSVRLLCDLINTVSAPPKDEDAPELGDLIYQQWVDDLTDSEPLERALEWCGFDVAQGQAGADPSAGPT